MGLEYLIITNLKGKTLAEVELSNRDFKIGYSRSLNNFWAGEDVGGRYEDVSRGGVRTSLPHLSREHCVIGKYRSGERYIKDLGSRTGTYVNGERISNKRQRGKKTIYPGNTIGLIPTKKGFLLKAYYEKH